MCTNKDINFKENWLVYTQLGCKWQTHFVEVFLIYLCNTLHNNCSVLYNYIYCLHYSQPVDVMRDGSGNSSSSVAAIVVPLVVLLLLTGIVVILVAVLVYQLIKYKRQSIE